MTDQDHGEILLDLTRENGEEGGVPTSVVIPKSPFDPKEARERVRSQIAQLLIVLLFVTVVSSFLIFVYDTNREEVKDLLGLIFTPLVGIIGTVLGFYFGSEKGD